MQNTPKLSVVLATYNRAETLRRTLDHLAKQELDSSCFEVLVIDDDSPDHTRHVVEEAIARFPARLSYLHHANRGPGYTQNRGIRAAKAPIVLLMADDIWLAPGALRAHIDAHDANPDPTVAVLGKVLQSPELTQSVFLKHWDPFQLQDLEGVKELPYSMFWVCNISAKRDFMLQNAMFREKVGRAGPSDHHDSEIGYRLHQHGLRILYDPDAWGHHYHPYNLGQAIDRYYERGLNWAPYTELVPDPEVVVRAHVLNFRTLRDHVRVLWGPNSLRGAERSLSWHIVRHLIRALTFNRWTVPWFWKPILDRAEASASVARLMHRQLYRVFLYYHFLRGIREAPARYRE
jgi:glycosyltransferase involved in cell wall biosynthesis